MRPLRAPALLVVAAIASCVAIACATTTAPTPTTTEPAPAPATSEPTTLEPAATTTEPAPAPLLEIPATGPLLLLDHVRVVGHSGDDAVLVAGERIVRVGPRDDVRALVAGRARVDVLDGGGGLLVPGFHDAHVHMEDGGQSLLRLDLAGDATLEQAVAHVARYAKEHPKLPWILGSGWQYGIVPTGELPTRQALDRVVRDRPVFLTAYDGHTGWANSKALALARITKDTKDPDSGTVVRDDKGVPTGALLEDAQSLLDSVVPQPTRAERKAALRTAARRLLDMGITAVDDIADDDETFELWRELEAEGKLPIRVRVCPPLRGDLSRYEEQRARRGSTLVEFGFLKAFVDGVVESKTAYMLRPYVGGSERGRPLMSRDDLYLLVDRAHQHGFQVALHAIGDAAVQLALDAFEHAQQKSPAIHLRHRVEHVEVLDPVDVPRFAALDVVASMQPYHANPFGNEPQKGPWAENLGPTRWPMTMAWRSVLAAKGALAFGSDWPVYTAHPLQGFAVAISRRDVDGLPAQGWNAFQAVKPDEALHAYSVERGGPQGPATDIGRIAPGQKADLVVLDPAVQLDDPKTLWNGTIRVVVVNGTVRVPG